MSKKEVNTELYPEKCDVVVTFKLSASERETLSKHCSELNVPISRFIRVAIKQLIQKETA